MVEYAGSAIRALSMEGRMTVCNMSIEGGARAGMVAPDETTFAWFAGRPGAPADLDAAVEAWRAMPSDADAVFDREEVIDAASLAPQVTWGTHPGMVAPITGRVPTPENSDEHDPESVRRALDYMGLRGRRGDRGHRHRHGLHRLVHERAPARPARRGVGRPRPPGRRRGARDGGPRAPCR